MPTPVCNPPAQEVLARIAAEMRFSALCARATGHPHVEQGRVRHASH